MVTFQKIIQNLSTKTTGCLIYQIGVRNPQGLTLSSFDGKIYINHGAKGGDWFGEVKKEKTMAGKY